MLTGDRQLIVRSANEADCQRLANLIHFEPFVHRHLDWRPPLDWIGQKPYLVIEDGEELLASLACPPDPPKVAWIRLFAVSSKILPSEAWYKLWSTAQSTLSVGNGSLHVAAIPLQGWFRKLLQESEFSPAHRVVVLTWSGGSPPAGKSIPGVIRPMNFDDLHDVEKVDATAFGEVWQNSHTCLEVAYSQATLATVAEIAGEVVGYQISTATAIGGHLARLAVKPDFQGQGIGYTLLRDMLLQFKRRGALDVSVNTQHDNLISLSLYHKAGFKRSSEEYTVFQYPAI
jgi:ribosomal protein S18 acetylase RimI-like enzyme